MDRRSDSGRVDGPPWTRSARGCAGNRPSYGDPIGRVGKHGDLPWRCKHVELDFDRRRRCTAFVARATRHFAARRRLRPRRSAAGGLRQHGPRACFGRHAAQRSHRSLCLRLRVVATALRSTTLGGRKQFGETPRRSGGRNPRCALLRHRCIAAACRRDFCMSTARSAPPPRVDGPTDRHPWPLDARRPRSLGRLLGPNRPPHRTLDDHGAIDPPLEPNAVLDRRHAMLSNGSHGNPLA